ncbi:MAG TPA: non-homologous end-joining DNA ligase [Acidimicrobiales bacterium]|nr:non-homologous end-joining DNA ligase [Acidimicrobiales bacterium]
MPGTEHRRVEVAGRTLEISHPDKVFFPGARATKLDLVEYYLAVADPLLAAAQWRPAMLQRFPEGALGSSFFQKRVPRGAPAWLTTLEVATPNGTTSNALVLADMAHVIWAVNLACIGFHLWPVRADRPEHVDELRIDLDPQPGVPFVRVREVAHLTRELLGELDVASFVKTSGGRGLHVYVALEPRWDATEVRAAAVALARELERRHPRLVTASWWKEDRGARVFVDYNQNAPHKTVFGAWSVRARTNAVVSAPLRWDELDDAEPDLLTMATVAERVRRSGDPWAPMHGAPQPLEPLLDLAARDRAAGLPDAPWPPQYPKQPGEPRRVSPSRARRPPPAR